MLPHGMIHIPVNHLPVTHICLYISKHLAVLQTVNKDSDAMLFGQKFSPWAFTSVEDSTSLTLTVNWQPFWRNNL